MRALARLEVDHESGRIIAAPDVRNADVWALFWLKMGWVAHIQFMAVPRPYTGTLDLKVQGRVTAAGLREVGLLLERSP